MRFLSSLLLATGLLLCTGTAAADRTVVIPVEFENLKLKSDSGKIQEMLDSASAYLNRQLHGKKEFDFDLADVVSLPRPFEYYGANSTDRKDANSPEAVLSACVALDPKYDFSSTDNIVLIPAGMNEAWGCGENFFWPAQSKLSEFNMSLALDGKKLDSFSICPELGPDSLMTGIGDFCHEYGHFLGLVDLYDTDGAGSGGDSHIGLDTLSLMASGNRNGSGRRPAPFTAADYCQIPEFAGIVPGKGEFSLDPIESAGDFAILNSAIDGKCYVLENRNDVLYITCIDRSSSFAGFSDRLKRNLTAAERWQYNEVNCNPEYKCAELVLHASEGSFSGDSLSVSIVRKEADALVLNVFEPVVITGMTAYQDAVSVNWKSELDISEIEKSGIGWWTEKEELTESEVVMLEDGSFHFTVEDLKPGTDYNISIHISTRNGSSFSRNITVATAAMRDDARAFIMLDSAGRNEDGTFRSGAKLPLRLRNAAGVAEVTWTFNGARIQAEADGMWTIPYSGKLKAVATKLDGSEEVIIKQINVR